MKLIRVVIWPSEKKLEAFVEDAKQERRKIDYNWLAKDSKMPTNWWDSVKAEAELQTSNDLGAAAGRVLF